ncbi:diguanylate cyclase (GGDEF)-like protein [Crossiella equi]|uniref:Diguanylate cyclase (GGDEF)-like protein n=1 Tax=Crossiella equi TaxID=130796 RepID=A0ABS5AH30_9PSEU|nr:GGDEF domain-containing protein [Crossiella equi]MBP2475878.1 diguanylate cyclase (GGDEF)-like protein [Crossiella equi]
MDALTSLPDGLGWTAHAERHFTPGHTAVLVVDLDRFHQVNDEQGHQAGDRALRAVAGLLRTHLEAGDLLARMKGDVFQVLTGRHGVLTRADALLAAARDQGIALSVGLATFGATVVELEQSAREALRRAKDAGGSQVRVAS